MKTFVKIAISVSLLSVLGGAYAGQKGAKPAVTKCPICKMDLATKSSAKNPTAVRLTKGGKVLYCCPGCKMPASVLVKKK